MSTLRFLSHQPTRLRPSSLSLSSIPAPLLPIHTTRLSSTIPVTKQTHPKHPESFTPPSTSDLHELQSTLQTFTKHEIPPSLAASTDSTNAFPAHLWPVLGEAGLLGITADPGVGGLGMGYQAHCLAMEELSRASGSIALSYAAHSQLCVNQIQLHGTPAQKEKFLPGLIRGEKVGALAMSESGAGSDVLGGMKMVATEDKENSGWRLTGEKMWITNGPDADIVVVYARTPPTEEQLQQDAEASAAAGKDRKVKCGRRKRQPMTAFIVETSTPGFSVARKLDKMGMRGSNTGELHFSNVFVPSDYVLGTLSHGHNVLMAGLDLERLVLSAGPLGLMQATLDCTLPYIHQRKQFGRPVAENQLVQGKIADMYTKMKSSRSYTYATARTMDQEGRVEGKDCAGAILYAAERGTEVALNGIQLLGGMGYVEEMPASRIMRDAKLYEIGAGTSEIRRMIIGRAFNKEYAHLA